MPCKILQGLLRGYDQTNNLVIEDCHERVFSATVRAAPSSHALTDCEVLRCLFVLNAWSSAQDGVALEQLGLYMVRGDNV